MIYDKFMVSHVITMLNNITYLIINEILRGKKNMESANMIRKYMELFSTYDEESDMGLYTIFDETRNEESEEWDDMGFGDIFE